MATYYDTSSFDIWTDEGVTYQGVLSPEGLFYYWVVHGVVTDDYIDRSSSEVPNPVCRACRYQTDEGHTEEKGCMFDSGSSDGWVED